MSINNLKLYRTTPCENIEMSETARPMENWSQCSVTISSPDSAHLTLPLSTAIQTTFSVCMESAPQFVPEAAEKISRTGRDRVFRTETTNLSRREHEVLRWMIEGKNTWEMSRILHISERTVYFHVRNILEKLGATCRSHAVSIALREAICEPAL